MSQNPESVPFVRQALQTLAPPARAGVSRPDERWSTLAGHAAVPQRDDRANRCFYSICLPWVQQDIPGRFWLLLINKKLPYLRLKCKFHIALTHKAYQPYAIIQFGLA
jgi:hypothetical protein